MTWCDGATGRVGVVSTLNSLVGDVDSASVGSGGGDGAEQWQLCSQEPCLDQRHDGQRRGGNLGDGTAGTVGVVSTANSLVGSAADDEGGSFVVALSNGNYVVGSPYWNDGGTADSGAVTWSNGAAGTLRFIHHRHVPRRRDHGRAVPLRLHRPAAARAAVADGVEATEHGIFAVGGTINKCRSL